MITLLSKIFIKTKEDAGEAYIRQAYGMLCGAVGIFLNLCLFTGKFLAGTFSNSIAITADAFNNLSDAGSSIITLIGFKMAGQKPDPSHPFGHGRIEYISGLLISVIILLMGLELVKSSISKILHPEILDFSPIIILVLVASILVKCYMFLYNRRLGRKLDSAAMLATATDSLSDTLATAAVLAATLISHFTDLAIDGWCGVLVGLFICFAGYHAAKDTISPLLGQAPEKEFVRQINDIVMAYENVIGIHDLIVHNYGPGRVLISLHAEVPADGEHEGPRRLVGGGHGGRAAGGEHDRGPGHGPAGPGGHRPGGGGDGGGEHLRRGRGPHGVSDPGRRAPGLFLQGGEHHGFHAGIRGAAL